MAYTRSKKSKYEKPGKGVKKDEAITDGKIKIFFKLFYNCFWQLFVLNLLFFIFFAVSGTILLVSFRIFGFSYISLFLSPLSAIPVTFGATGLFFVMRNMIRREPISIFSDFFGAIRKNIGLTFIQSLVNYFIALLCLFMYYYHSLSGIVEALGFIADIPVIIFAAIIILFIFSQFYFYILIVTFDLKYRQLFKNSLILSLSYAFKNIFTTILFAIPWAVFFLPAYYIGSITIGILSAFVIVIAFSFTAFVITYRSYPVIEKNLIIPYFSEEKEADGAAVADSQDIDAEQTQANPPPEPKAPPVPSINRNEYVFRDGKLIKLSEVSNAEVIFEDKG